MVGTTIGSYRISDIGSRPGLLVGIRPALDLDQQERQCWMGGLTDGRTKESFLGMRESHDDNDDDR